MTNNELRLSYDFNVSLIRIDGFDFKRKHLGKGIITDMFNKKKDVHYCLTHEDSNIRCYGFKRYFLRVLDLDIIDPVEVALDDTQKDIANKVLEKQGLISE